MWRGILFSALIACSAYLPLPVTARAESFAGKWHLVFYGKCVLTRENLAACDRLQSPAAFAVTRDVGATITVRGTGDYVADARGHYTVRFATSVEERTPGGPSVARCDNATVFSTAFNGNCTEHGTGHGHIAKGATGMVDFWQDDVSGYWAGSGARFVESVPTDTLNPACAGVLNTGKFMRLLGVRHVPAGITARFVLTHKDR